LIELCALTTHEAVLVGLYGAFREECGVADVEDAAEVLLVSVVAVGPVQAAERR